MQKMVTLVDTSDKVIGQADIYEAHQHPAKLHRAPSVWLIKKTGNMPSGKAVFFQKRSLRKIVGAGQWGNGICGNVLPNESYEECARRRLREEIGVTAKIDLKPLYKFEYQVYSNEKYGEHEIDQVYLGEYDGEFELNPEEVSEIVWLDYGLLIEQLRGKKIIGAPETLGVGTDQLKELTPPLKISINGAEYEITPWTAIMLGDERLLDALAAF